MYQNALLSIACHVDTQLLDSKPDLTIRFFEKKTVSEPSFELYRAQPENQMIWLKRNYLLET